MGFFETLGNVFNKSSESGVKNNETFQTFSNAYKEHKESKILDTQLDKQISSIGDYMKSKKDIQPEFAEAIIAQAEKLKKPGIAVNWKYIFNTFKISSVPHNDVSKQVADAENSIKQIVDFSKGDAMIAASLASTPEEQNINNKMQNLQIDITTIKGNDGISPAKYKQELIKKLDDFAVSIGAKQETQSSVKNSNNLPVGIDAGPASDVYKQSVNKFIDATLKLEGAKYVRGGESTEGIDCSGLIIQGWKENAIIDDKFDATAAGIYENYVQKDIKIDEIKRGDFLFYKNKSQTKNYKPGDVSHVMIALGPVENGKIKIYDASVSHGAKEREIDIGGSSKYEVLTGRPASAYTAITNTTKLEKMA